MIASDPSNKESGQESPAVSLIDHIQGVMEHQKALLARELHDELGGLLVGAVMDLAWAEQHLSAPPLDLRQKLTRARQTLAAAIDLKRKLIEELRPTLLDNVGLFAALRWHVQAACKRAGLTCTIKVPEEERRFLPNVPITLFRIVQEALAVVVARRPDRPVEFSVVVAEPLLTIEIHSPTTAIPDDATAGPDAHYLAAIDQRVVSLGGQFTQAELPLNTITLTANFPLGTTLPAG